MRTKKLRTSNLTLVEVEFYEVYINANGESHFVGEFAGNTPLSVIAAEIDSAELKLKEANQNEVK